MDTRNVRNMITLIEEVLDRYKAGEEAAERARKEVVALAVELIEDQQQGIANVYIEEEGEEDNWLPVDEEAHRAFYMGGIYDDQAVSI